MDPVAGAGDDPRSHRVVRAVPAGRGSQALLRLRVEGARRLVRRGGQAAARRGYRCGDLPARQKDAVATGGPRTGVRGRARVLRRYGVAAAASGRAVHHRGAVAEAPGSPGGRAAGRGAVARAAGRARGRRGRPAVPSGPGSDLVDPDVARRVPGGARPEAPHPELRRPGAGRGGRPRARKGAGVARPATGTGRQAQVAGLLVAAALGAGGAGGAACARQGEPPGGPPHTTPPKIVRVTPESGAVVPALKGDAVIEFDEVIDEMPGSRGGGAAAITGLAHQITGLAHQIVLSPVTGEVRGSWHRSAIHVKPVEGWN